jgi:hypothetical protein
MTKATQYQILASALILCGALAFGITGSAFLGWFIAGIGIFAGICSFFFELTPTARGYSHFAASMLLPLLGLSLLFNLFYELGLRLAFESNGPINWDTSIYQAVGRGILNGILPWTGLFETKPPGIFFLSAFSGLWGRDFPLNGPIQVLVIILPLLLIPFNFKGEWTLKNPLSSESSPALLLMISAVLVMLFGAERSGEFQIELIGTLPATLWMTLILNPQWFSARTRFIFSALLLMITIGFKEPFLFVMIGVSLLLLPRLKQWIQSFLLPLLVGGLTGLALMFLTGMGSAYFSYLNFMLNHTGRHGSPWARSFNFDRIIDDLSNFASGLPYLLGGLLLLSLLSQMSLDPQKHPAKKILGLLTFSVALWLNNLAVGLGGDYYNHHFAFALPFWLALIILTGRSNLSVDLKNLRLIIWVIAIFVTLALPDIDYQGRARVIEQGVNSAKAEAQYLDDVLSASQTQNWVFLGTNGFQLYGFTKHSPMGPWFFQYPEWFTPQTRERGESILINLKKADIVVVDRFLIGEHDAIAREILKEYYSRTPWPQVKDIKRTERRYSFYFRNQLEHETTPNATPHF